MKNIILFLLSFFLLSCSSDDEDFSNPEFVDAVTGRYVLISAETEVALDLNHDGEAYTNLLLNENYCNAALLFNSYYAGLVHRESSYTEIYFELPYSGLDFNMNQSSCISSNLVFNDIVIDEVGEEVIMIQSDFRDDFIANFHAKVIDIYWEEEVVYVTVEKQFFDANNEWVDTLLYLAFEKFSNKGG